MAGQKENLVIRYDANGYVEHGKDRFAIIVLPDLDEVSPLNRSERDTVLSFAEQFSRVGAFRDRLIEADIIDIIPLGTHNTLVGRTPRELNGGGNSEIIIPVTMGIGIRSKA